MSYTGPLNEPSDLPQPLPEKVDDKPWTLNIGCHSGTLMSRDLTTEQYATLEDCRKKAIDKEAAWKRLGYYVWYATAIGPNGERVTLHDGTYYD